MSNAFIVSLNLPRVSVWKVHKNEHNVIHEELTEIDLVVMAKNKNEALENALSYISNQTKNPSQTKYTTNGFFDTEELISEIRKFNHKIYPVFKFISTCAN
ncbi:hypothetical protein QLL95_gp0229 [Cotonvirus japonicus]|uniref:Uncharacterized protein n=1 Tax=Cotonvirus japonicus TaxID=2811091 RepID=A0ABM7NRD0_9VIRU|nr:hypothetical protein QLL95_gp0229 [Cotonvirus japonicus]BCS82718.1 hypothetical protein [Cotonvirus japonicus]